MSITNNLLYSFHRHVGLLVLRICMGSFMMFGHGLGKLANFGSYAEQFPDYFGLGGTFTLGLAVFSEFFCALLIILGLFTRLATIPLIATMLMAAFVAHGEDPFAKKEMALLFLTGFSTLFFTGPGKYSIDGKIGSDRFD